MSFSFLTGKPNMLIMFRPCTEPNSEVYMAFSAMGYMMPIP